jgi:hypothetical protein
VPERTALAPTIVCAVCASPISYHRPPGPRRAYCSTRCATDANNAAQRDKRRASPRTVPSSRACAECGESFAPQTAHNVVCLVCWKRKLRVSHLARPAVEVPCFTCGEPVLTSSVRANCEACRRVSRLVARKQDHHRRRAVSRETDITSADLARMIAARTFCPLCRRKMSDDHRSPRAKQIDHIIPVGAGGLHIRANVRVICATCNNRRPLDGSDTIAQLGFCITGPGTGATNRG